MASHLLQAPPIAPFDIDDPNNIGTRWDMWKKRLEVYITATGLEDDKQKRALLLFCAGESVHQLFENLPNAENAKDYKDTLQLLTDHFSPKKNKTFEIYKFRQAQQLDGESVDQFYTRLRQLASTCQFTATDNEIRTQIIQRCLSTKLREAALRDDAITLAKLLDHGRAFENSTKQASDMEKVLATQTNEFSALAINDGRPNERDKSPYRTTTYRNKGRQSTDRNSPGKPRLLSHGNNDDRRTNQRQSASKCYNCGNSWPHVDSPCPARGKSCRNCDRLGHFAKVCRSTTTMPSRHRNKQTVRNIDQDSASSSDSDEWLYTLHTRQQKPTKTPSTIHRVNLPQAKIKINNVNFKLMIDTGASINVLDENTFTRLQNAGKVHQIKLTKPKTKIYAYGSKVPLSVLGTFTTEVESRRRLTSATFYVVKEDHGSLLSCKTAQELDLIKLNVNSVKQTKKASQKKPQSVEQSPVKSPRSTSDNCTIKCPATATSAKTRALVTEYQQLFQGVGKMKDVEIKLHIDPDVPPVTQPPRRIPFHLRKQVAAELKRLEENDIIEDATGPTPWVSPIVAAPKPKNPNEVRVCIDMRLPNRAIRRERHPSPTVDDIINSLNGATKFSKLDLRSGYHQLVLAPESRYITTFSTHKGLKRYKRLNFGTSSAAEIFQHAIQQVLEGVQGALNISDDIIIFGKTTAEHDLALAQTFQRLSEKGLTLNPEKCVFDKDHLDFFGYTFGPAGMSPDPKKVQAIRDASPPSNVAELRSFLGTVNYVSRFIYNFSTVTAPLRDLTCHAAKWQWTPQHQHAFDELKHRLTTSPTMAYFDPAKNTEILVDASPVGLGAILTQKSTTGDGETKIVAYASRSLTAVEQRYSQTEREALACIWACEKFHLYVYGAPFSLVTDHKPLVYIFSNPKAKPPARLERWSLRLQPYNFTIRYEPGKNNPADYMSRHPLQNQPQRERNIAEEYVSLLTTAAVPNAMTLAEIQEATSSDPTLQKLAELIRSQQWHSILKQNANNTSGTSPIDLKDLKAFHKIRNELTVSTNNDVILRGSRLVMPASLRYRALSLAHEGHQGLIRTKQLLREKVWFPRIDQEAETMVKHCLPCQAATPENWQEPLQMSPLPNGPWKNVAADFYGPLPNGQTLMVVIDEYSRYPEVETVSSTSATAVIPKLDKIFAAHGIPEQLKTDNGPPFNSHSFKVFAKELGFIHRKITPLWPKANAEAERFMRTLGKAIRTARTEGKNWQKELNKFLRNYRSTPHPTTGISPAESLMGRKIKTKLPEIPTTHPTHPSISTRDSSIKQKMKTYADERNHAKSRNFTVGDLVLPRQQKKNKFSTPFQPQPFRVIEVKGSMITAMSKGTKITRNSSHFKLLPPDMMSDLFIPPTHTEEERGEENDQNPSSRSDLSNNDQNSRYPIRCSRNTRPDYYKA